MITNESKILENMNEMEKQNQELIEQMMKYLENEFKTIVDKINEQDEIIDLLKKEIEDLKQDKMYNINDLEELNKE